MSSRSPFGFVVAIASVGLLACSGAFAISACSSSTDGTDGDGGVDAGADTRKVVEASPEEDSAVPLTPEQCEAACKVKHPGAAAKEDLIDQCWADKCTAPCIDQSGGFDAGADAAPPVDAGGMLCGTEVSSGVDETCDQCTQAFCCDSWKGCFADPDCTAYDSCIGDCNP